MRSEPDGAGSRRARGRARRAPRVLAVIAALAVATASLLLVAHVALFRGDDPTAGAVAAAARQNVIGYEVTAAARAIAGEDPVARRRGLATLHEARLQLAAGPASPLQAVAERSGRTGTIAGAFDALEAAAGGLASAAEAGARLETQVAQVEQRAELYRLGIDALLFDAGLAAEAARDAARRVELILLGVAVVLGVALAVTAPRSRRDAAALRPAAGNRPTDRALLARSLGDAILRARRASGMAALLLANLDQFKSINDRHGPEAGDALLRQVGNRLLATVRDSDIVAHLGGDEFAVVVEGLQRAEDAGRVARKLLAALSEHFTVDGRRIHVTASIGIVLYPLDGVEADELLRAADTAMYAAKAAGRNRYQFSTEELRAQTAERMSLVEGLRQALDRPEELELVYQPKVDMATGELVGVEALIRWHHPELGTVLPDRFIGVAEETDLIVPLGRWVIAQACSQAQRWRRSGQQHLKVSVNVSSRQFRHGDLVETISDALTAAGLDPHWLEVELTEGTLAEDTASVRRTLERLKAMGVKVSIDDFGTGYSSLSYLKRFPIDALKIDRSFIRDVTEDPDDAAISQAIVSLARSLRLQVVAEGVETPEQLEFVRTLGCDTVQGFLISRPLNVEDVGDFVVRLDERAAV